MKVSTFLDYHKIPSHSFLAAMNAVIAEGDLEASEYRVRITELTGRGGELLDREAKYTYMYLIQESVREQVKNPDIQLNMAIQYNIAERKAIDYIEANPWLFVECEETPKIDANGKVKKKRGAKKDLVCKLWVEHKDDGWTRKQWIDFLVEAAEMTKAGASTYYANLCNNTFGCK